MPTIRIEKEKVLTALIYEHEKRLELSENTVTHFEKNIT